ncbi:hypothetical protein CRI94_08725 [Longibacter salinarum]|uniref:VCBS repeat-containing protein n=1 Tax=Longibacter salinarum TaxID=1850348 RepID=A0A2A8CXQ1_9BACT|nr:VCBS repeat-containing protein [Longibacter salinarum]PEN13400.1 hypothetical protein CRI94_08725 [Longibacter salinarum]
MTRSAASSISFALLALVAGVLTFAGATGSTGSAQSSGVADDTTMLFRDATVKHLPTSELTGYSMDAAVADVNGDGALDVVIANEFKPNILLLGDGTGHFRDASERIPSHDRDSEDVAVADFDGDGYLDIVVVTEDDTVNEFYLNDGSGHFRDAGDRWPVEGTSNAVIVVDLDDNGFPDLLVGNNGQNRALINDSTGRFSDETASRLPSRDDVTQDLELGDVDGDGDLDLIVGNEDVNRLLLNDGRGRFRDADPRALPILDVPEETREADFGDVDGDGDLDLIFANVRLFVEDARRQNRLLLNDGSGRFRDATAARIPIDDQSSLDADFVDLDLDGDLDIVTSNVLFDGESIKSAPYGILLNDGGGRFSDATRFALPKIITGRGLDSEAADFDSDGRPDLFLCSRGTVDRLLLSVPPPLPDTIAVDTLTTDSLSRDTMSRDSASSDSMLQDTTLTDTLSTD